MTPREDEQANPAVIEATAPYVRALGRHEDSPNARAAFEALGDSPVVTELVVGAPASVERYLNFPSGAEVLVRDGIVAAFWFHREPSLMSPEGFHPDRLVRGLAAAASRDDVRALLGPPRRSSLGIQSQAFAVCDATLIVTWVDLDDAAKDPTRRPGVSEVMIRPKEIDRVTRALGAVCRECADLVVRDDRGSMDVDATLGELTAAVGAKGLWEDAYFVPLRDVRALRASGLMERIEVHLDCPTCRTAWCLVVPREGEATFMNVGGLAWQHPKPAMPPLELWADPARQAEAGAVMQVLFDGGSWFLLEKAGELYLDARYTAGAFIDGSVLIRLTADEAAAYEREGLRFLGGLQRTIEESAPWMKESSWYARDLKRQSDQRDLCGEVSPAVGAWRREQAWTAKDQT